MLVLADAQALQKTVSAQRGIGRYVAEYATAVEQNHPGAVRGWVLRSELPIPELPELILNRGLFRLHDDANTPNPDVWHILSPFEWMLDPADRVRPPWASGSRTRLVVTLYDLIPLLYPTRYLQNNTLRRAYMSRLRLIESADRILAISEASANDAVRLLHIPPSHIDVVGTGVSEHFIPPDSITGSFEQVHREIPRLRPGYVMYTGGIDFRKNISGLMQAYSKLPSELRVNHQLVIVCAVVDSERDHLELTARALGIDADFLLTGYVPDDTLLGLYQAAHLFIFPSLYEGFGLPVVEALSCGVPAIVGANSSLTELVPDPRAHFDAGSVDSICRALFNVLKNEPFRASLKKAILRKDYRWNVVAERSLDSYSLSVRKTRKHFSLPRIALISPMPPARSGVADYSMSLLREFVGLVEVDVFAESSADRPAMVGVTWFDYEAFEITEKIRGPYATRLFAMGNSSHHVEVLRLLRSWHGVVISHDTRYTGLIGVLAQQAPELIDPVSAEVLGAIQAGRPPGMHDDQQSVEPGNYFAVNSLLTEQALLGSTKILVHSNAARMLARSNMEIATRDMVAVVPFGHRIRSAKGDIKKDTVISLGVVHHVKRSEIVCAAFISLAKRHPGLIFAIVGEIQDGLEPALRHMIEAADVGSRVILAGRVGEGEYDAWMSRSLLAIQLRAVSNGESSAAVADCFGAGVPVVATNIGAMADFDRLCELVSPSITTADLVDLIERLLADENERNRLSELGRQHAQANTFDKAARALLDVAEVGQKPRSE